MKKTIAAGLILASWAWARSTGSRYILDPFTEALRHQQGQGQEPGAARSQPDSPVEALLPDAGQIAVVDDADGISSPAVPFNLDQKTLQFQPGGTDAPRYTYSVSGSRFDVAAASASTRVTLGDDDAVRVDIPFAFPFYGQRYAAVFIHSDGNLTFGRPEASSDPRDVGRLAAGPPRIGALFTDLDPTQPDASVGFVASTSRFLVTWRNVPLFSDKPGTGVARQTFQAALYPDGRIELSYAGITIDLVAVGIAPGGATLSAVALVDFSAASASTFAVAVAEQFTSTPTFNPVATAAKFYRNHEDAYDFVAVYDTANRSSNICGFVLQARNSVHGIGSRPNSLGAEEFDSGASLGSAARLQTFVYLGFFGQYPADPAQRGACGASFSLLTLLGQLAGFRFLAYPRSVDPATGQPSSELLGRDASHWSYYLNTDGSVMEGNQIEDKGQGVSPRFETKDILQRYSSLDQYLMGLRAPEDVPATFLVRQPSIGFPPGHAPQSGVLFNGTRVDITVPKIVAAEGRRAPDYALSPKRFRFAFVLLVGAGATPRQADIDKLDQLRNAWETFFARATDNRGQVETQLVKSLRLSVRPATGLIQGRTLTATLALGAPATTAVAVTLSASSASINVPPTVTVPPGSRSVDFSIAGVGPGIAELTAQGPNNSYELGRAFLNVRPSASGLTLERLDARVLPGLILPSLSQFLPFSGGEWRIGRRRSGVSTARRELPALSWAAAQRDH